MTLLVVRRFCLKCVAFSVWASAQAALGHGFFSPLSTMALLSAVLCLLLAHHRR